MTPDELAELRADNAAKADEARERIRERAQQRQDDPDWIFSDARATGDGLHFGEPVGSPYVEKSADAAVLYRTFKPNEQAGAPASEGPPDTARLFGDQRDEMLCEALGHVIRALRVERRRDMAKLHRQFASWRREWRIERRLLNDQIATLRKRLDVSDTVERGSVVDWRKRHA